MQLTPNQRKFLDKIGINSTRLQWRLYQWEKRFQAAPNTLKLPTGLRWLKYPHKFCFHCGALVDREAKVCPKCDHAVYPMWAYRLFRLGGLMIPEGASPVTLVFLAVMIGLFLLSLANQGMGGLRGPSERFLMVLGAWSPAATLLRHEYWRYLAFGLVHFGLLHILFNGVALFQVGPLVEQAAGSKRMLTLVTFTQLTSALATHIWYVTLTGQVYAISVGASGWLFGVIGFGIAYFHARGGTGKVYTRFLIQWAIYGLLFGFFIGANNAAHLGGMLGGLALGSAPEGGQVRGRYWESLWTVGFWVSVALWVITAGFMAHSIFSHWTPPVVAP